MFDVPNFGLVIDTDQYAGNFEREIAAFCTGVIGDCGVGWGEAGDFVEAFGFDIAEENNNDIVYQMADEHGCLRPCALWNTPGWFNNGLGGHFKDHEEGKAQAHYDEQIEKDIERTKRINWVTESAREKAVAEAKKKRGSKFNKWPAMMSVIVYLESRPSAEFLTRFRSRAIEYCSDKGIGISGIRLLKFELRIEEETV